MDDCQMGWQPAACFTAAQASNFGELTTIKMDYLQ